MSFFASLSIPYSNSLIDYNYNNCAFSTLELAPGLTLSWRQESPLKGAGKPLRRARNHPAQQHG
ncbi:hypothetical protein SAMN04488056_103328 [Cohaesibacter marisflavi]|uniref:Uncharacterized protein n=1 Tax=Cohaesibacter marisflavi TaxID=655353 RepID=A0A1I5ETZ7_9HYPH|nr:hypothetical protein SAMN04488056_103328 [Cohaesibacter marisflavi]